METTRQLVANVRMSMKVAQRTRLMEVIVNQKKANATNEIKYDMRHRMKHSMVHVVDSVTRTDLRKSRNYAGGKLQTRKGRK